MRAAVVDLEHATTGALARLLTGHDAVVYAAGAGYGSSTRQKTAIDRDAAIRTVDAARLSGVRRFVMISSMGVDLPVLPGAFGTYLRLKAEADGYLRSQRWMAGRVQPDHPCRVVELPLTHRDVQVVGDGVAVLGCGGG